MNDILPGYLVKIKSWENDLGNYNTTEFSGLTESAARVLISIAKLFYSENDGSFINGKWKKLRENAFGNSDIDRTRDALTQAITQIVDSARRLNYDIPKEWDFMNPDYADFVNDIRNSLSDFYQKSIYDLIGIWCEGELYRVFDSFEVYLVPESSIKNVTADFGG